MGGSHAYIESTERTEFNSLRAVSQEVPDPSASEWGEAQICEFAEEDVRYDGIEGLAIIDKKHPHIALLMFQMAQRIVESYGYCILSRPVSSVGKLMIIEGEGGRQVFRWCSTSLSKHFMMICVWAMGR